MDLDNVAATDGVEFTHQNGIYLQSPSPGEDGVSDDSICKSTEAVLPNGNAKIVVKLDDGKTNDSSTGEVKEELNVQSANNGLTIPKVLVLCFFFFFLIRSWSIANPFHVPTVWGSERC